MWNQRLDWRLIRPCEGQLSVRLKTINFQELSHPPEQGEVTNMVKVIFEKGYGKWCKGVDVPCWCPMCHHIQILQRHPFLASSAAFRINMTLGTLIEIHLLVFTSVIFSLYAELVTCTASYSCPHFTPATATVISFMLAKFGSVSPQTTEAPLTLRVREMAVETHSYMQSTSAGREPLIGRHGAAREMLPLLFLRQIILGYIVYSFSEGPGGIELQLLTALTKWTTHSSFSALCPVLLSTASHFHFLSFPLHQMQFGVLDCAWKCSLGSSVEWESWLRNPCSAHLSHLDIRAPSWSQTTHLPDKTR